MRSAVCLCLLALAPAVLLADPSSTNAPAPQPSASPVGILRQVTYSIELTDQEARGTVEVDMETQGKGTLTMPFLQGEIAVPFRELPSGLALARSGRQYQLVAEGNEHYRFSLPFMAKVVNSEPWRQICFVGMADAAVAAVDAQAQGAGVELQLMKGTTLESTQTMARAHLRGFLGAERTVSLRWRSRAAEVARQGLLTCDTETAVRIAPTALKYQTCLTYEILQGAATRLSIALPAVHALTRLQGEQIRDWQVVTEGDHQLLTVAFLKPMENSYTLTLFSEQSVESSPATARVTAPQPLDVSREAGRITLSAEDMLVETQAADGLRQVNTPDGTFAAYQFYVRPCALTLLLRRIDPVVKVADRVSLRLEETRLLATHAMALTVEKAGIYAAELSPLGAFTVADVRGENVQDWKVAGGKLAVTFGRRVLGDYKFDVQMEQPLATLPDRLDVAPLGVAGATEQKAQIGVASAPGLQLRTQEVRGAREIPAASLAGFHGELLGFNTEQPDWSLALSVQRLEARTFSEIFNLVTIGDGMIGGSAIVRYALLNQGVQEFRLTLPPQWKNVDFTGPGIRRKELQNGEWGVSLQEKAWNGYTLVVTYDFPFDPQTATLALGGIHTPGVERESGIVAVGSVPSLQLQEHTAAAAPPAQLFRIDESEMAAEDRALSTQPILLAYRYSGNAYDVSVDVKRFTQVPVLQAVADRTQLSTVLTQEGQLLTQATFMVKNNEKQFQRFVLPAGAAFWACYVDGAPVKPEQDAGAVLVPLPRGANRDKAFAIQIVYAQKTDAITSRLPRRIHLAAPRTDIQTTYAEWELYTPATHSLSRFGGNMTVAHGTTYGLRDAWREFVRFYDNAILRLRGLAVGLVVLGGSIAFLVLAIRRRWTSVVALLAVGFVLAILAGMLLPAIGSARERARRSGSMNNLKQIGLALRLYSEAHDGQFPASLEELSNTQPLVDRLAIDPVSGDRYAYVGSGRNENGAADAVLAYSPAGSGDGRNVLFVDGHVQWLSEKDFNDALARTPATPVNSPPAQREVMSTPSRPPADHRRAVLDAMGKIVIPEIDLRQAKLQDAVQFLQQASAEFDPEHRGVNMILNLGGPAAAPGETTDVFNEAMAGAGIGAGETPLITFTARTISLLEALKIVTKVANVKYRIEGDAVMIVPFNALEGDIIVRTYDALPVVAEKIPALASEFGAGQGGAAGEFHAMKEAPASTPDNDWKSFLTQMGVKWPEGASLRYLPSIGKIVVANTADNLATFEEILHSLSGAPSTSSEAGGRPSAPATVAGVQPIRIEIPRAGERYVFTKVLDVRDEPLEVHAWAVKDTVRAGVQGAAALAAFLLGLLVVWRQRRRRAPSAFRIAVGAALIAVSVGGVLLLSRLLGWAFILGAPLVGIVALVGFVRFLRARRTGPASDAAGGPPPIPTSAVVLLLALCLARSVAAAEAPTLRSVAYVGTVREKVADVEATLTLSAPSVDRDGTVVPLFGTDVATTGITSDSSHLMLVRDGAGVGVRLDRRGDYTCTVRFLAELGGDVGKRELAFGIPPALVSRVTLTIPEPEAEVEFPDAVAFKTSGAGEGTGGVTRVDATLGAAEKVCLRWTPRVKHAAEVAATVFCRNDAVVAVGNGVVNVKAALDYQVTQGELREARLVLPAGQRLLRVEGEDVRTWDVKAEGSNAVLCVELAKGTVSDFRMTVETEEALGTVPAQVSVRIPHALDVKRETGMLALRSSEELALSVTRAEGVQKVDTEEFSSAASRPAAGAPADQTDKTPGGPVFRSVYRYLTPGFALVCQADAVRPQVEVVSINQMSVGPESLRIAARLNYTIKRAGLFRLRLSLPAGYTLTGVEGDRIAQWSEQTGVGQRLLEVALKERVSGPCAVTVNLYQWAKELPKSVEVAGVYPLDAQKVTGYVKLGAELGVQLRVRSASGLTEVPAATVADAAAGWPNGVLAYKFIQEGGGMGAPWKLSLATEVVEPWVRAEVVNWLTVSETEAGLVTGKAQVRYEIQNAPLREFRLKVPAAFRNVDISGDNIRRRDQEGDAWRVELQSKRSGVYRLTLTWEQPVDAASGTFDATGVQALGVERETGAFAVFARPPLQVMEKAVRGDLLRTDVRELPEWAGRADEAALAYRYLRPGGGLTVGVRRFSDAAVLNAIVDNARLTTVVSEDGQTMTEMALRVRNNARQYLEVTLPEGAQLWSAFVGGTAVQPSARGDRIMLPLDRADSQDGAVAVELTYVGETAFPRRRGAVELASPSVDVPLKDAQWELYLPPDYDYAGFRGTMTYQPEAVSVARLYSFSMSDYSELEGKKQAARQEQVTVNLKRAQQKLGENSVQEANLYFEQASQQAEYDGDKADDARRLKGSLRKANADNLRQGQQRLNDFYNGAAGNQPAAPQGLAAGDEDVAAQQWDRLLQVQELAVAKVRPLHVALPERGLRYAFFQPLQTEPGQRMTIRMRAVNTRGISLPLAVLFAAVGFAALWLGARRAKP